MPGQMVRIYIIFKEIFDPLSVSERCPKSGQSRFCELFHNFSEPDKRVSQFSVSRFWTVPPISYFPKFFSIPHIFHGMKIAPLKVPRFDAHHDG